MSYIAFALKYRPQNFDEMVGQRHIVSALKSAVLNNRIHHAYLFSGPRGIGKTSLARILAKSLNCLGGITANPCGKCVSCQEIVKGTSLDVIEIDGASNRGIDEIRTLRENVKLSPTYSRFKIYIIDEVHMLTQEAFNALLKTLEEPPLHVKFIFATTHPHKVLPTILSRCQKLQFNLLPIEQIVEKLKKILKLEKINVNESFLYAIARSSEGSIRDAESLLDQCVPLLHKEELPCDIFSFLGIIEEESLNVMVERIVGRDLNGALDFVNKLVSDGKDLGVFLNNIIEHFKNMILVRLSPKAFGELVYVSPQTKAFLKQKSNLFSVRETLKVIDLFIKAKDLARKLNSVRIPFELTLIKCCYKEDQPLPKTPPGGSQEAKARVSLSTPRPAQKVSEESSSPKSTSPAAPEVKDEKDESNTDELAGDWENFELESKHQQPEHQVSLSTSSQVDRDSVPTPKDMEELKKIGECWPQVISELKKVRAALGTYLSEATLISVCQGMLQISFPKRLAFHKEIVERNNNKEFIEKVLETQFKQPLRIKFILAAEKKDDFDEHVYPKKDEDHKFIDELLDTFEGTIDTSFDDA